MRGLLVGMVCVLVGCSSGGGGDNPDVVADHAGSDATSPMDAPMGTDAGHDAQMQPDTEMQPDVQMQPDGMLTCATGQTVCGTACADLQNDRANCGSCSHACPADQACIAGACTGGSTCATGQTSCGGACVNTQADPANCGSCSHACAAGQTCTAGSCVAAMTCSGTQTDCGGACVDTQTDAANCGACAHACAAGQNCSAGSCVAATCAGTQMRCSGVCVDTTSDAANCGSCSHACAAGQVCTSGACVAACAAPRMTCTVSGASVCIDTTSDPANCGSCGHVCPAGQTCVSGACGCAAGQTSCGGACTNTTTDNANCGSCGHACTGGQSCSGGTCVCPAGQTSCGGTCINTMTDPAHCGACGTACTAPATCNAGVCNTLCGAGTTACAGMCVIVGSDNHNCGGCGNVCSTGTSCVAGACVPPNDARANAATLTLADAEVTVAGTTSGSSHDGPSVPCSCTSGGDVWYRFSVAATREIVYFDTAGSGFDTSLYITDSTGAAIPAQAGTSTSTYAGACNDDAHCASGGFASTYESQTAATLSGPATYYLVVSGCAQGAFTLHAQHLVATTATAQYWYTSPLTGTGTATTFLNGTNVTAGTCGGTGSGEDARWFTTCGGQQEFFSLCQSDTGATYERRLNTTYHDPAMYIRSAQTGAQVDCNDDGTSMGGTNCVGTVSGTGGTFVNDTANYGSRLNNVVAPRGLNSEYVDDRLAPGMHYSMVYTVR